MKKKVDRVQDWRVFAEHVAEYIEINTIKKYNVDGDDENRIDLLSMSSEEVMKWNILKYALRLYNGKGKRHDIEKVVHYSEALWTKTKKNG